MIESLAKGGANIYELNTLRKAISQTKGGKLAQAAFPAKVTRTLFHSTECFNAHAQMVQIMSNLLSYLLSASKTRRLGKPNMDP